MKKFLCILFIIHYAINGFNQKINYLHIRDSLALISCGNHDSNIIFLAIENLEKYDAGLLGKHINLYYEDLAISYWKAGGLNNEELLRKGIQANLSALYYKPNSRRALTGLILSHAWLGSCPEAMYYLETLRKITPKRKWDRDQEKMVLSKCSH